jgi:hypothetical protein
MASTSQLTSALTASAGIAESSCTGAGMLVAYVVASAEGVGDGEGMPVPSVSPAQATLAIDTTNRQLPRNCAIFVIVTFPLCEITASYAAAIALVV